MRRRDGQLGPAGGAEAAAPRKNWFLVTTGARARIDDASGPCPQSLTPGPIAAAAHFRLFLRMTGLCIAPFPARARFIGSLF